ncbi:hypothetical protein N1851_017522 [Merluccius polli]|uniref:Alkylated DNA repair protein AlkB homologue 8 N-terminal domain-containing protein n=1 Tax=Merluccius polli TaxID=89951 RepID=A0AA47MPY8_MERPO|nr:hypothetical protein N1851_017522 [Merluccius polli]
MLASQGTLPRVPCREVNINSLRKNAQQRTYLQQLKKLNLPKTMMVHFYTAVIESVLTSSITAQDKARLQRIICSAEKVIGCSLPSLQDLHASRTRRRAGKTAADPLPPQTQTL